MSRQLEIEPHRILVVKTSSLGDIVHVTPCLRALRTRYPRARIAMVVAPAFAPIVRHNPHVDVLIETRPRGQGRVRQFLGALADLAAEQPFDLALDFQGTFRSAAYVYGSRARVQAGFGSCRPGWSVRRAFSDEHAVAQNASILEALGISVASTNPEVFWSTTDERAVDERLATMGLEPERFLLLNPFGRWASKCWPLKSYVELIGRLRADGWPLVVTGGPEEREAMDRLARLDGTSGLFDLVGRVSLGEAICLIRRAALMVTGDSGPMHIAAALGTPLVALFGPTLPERTRPWRQLDSVVQARRPARHHAYRSANATEYMAAIPVDLVLERIVAFRSAKRR